MIHYSKFIYRFNTLVISLLLMSFLVFAQNAKIDSLRKMLSSSQDTLQLNVILELCWQYRNVQSDTAIMYGNQAINLAQNFKKDRKHAQAYNYLSAIYRNKGDYNTALAMSQRGSQIAEQAGDKEQTGYALQSMGEINAKLGNLKQAIEYAIKGLQIFEEIKNLRGIAFCYLTLGNIHTSEDDLQKAYYYYGKALKVRQEEKDMGGIATATAMLGITLNKQEKYKEALVFMHQAKAIYFKLHNDRNVASMFNSIAKVHLATNRLDSAIIYAEQSISLAKKIGLKDVIKECYETLFKVYASEKKFTMAFSYQSLYILYNDSIFNEEKNRQVQEMQNRYQNEKQKSEIDLLKSENERKTLLNWAFIVGLVLLVGLALAFWRGNYVKKRANLLLEKQHHEIKEKSTRLLELNDELNQTNEELNLNLEIVNKQNAEIQQKNGIIEKKNKDVADSITYAKRIQMAILPSISSLKQHIADCFVLFKPRDIVSGDFYWSAKKGDKILLAVADCTGHGVPGAFMSMIANDLLNLIVHEKEIHSLDLILAEMHKLIRQVLKQDENDSRDGLDIAICCIDLENKILEYAGAMNPLYIIQEKENENGEIVPSMLTEIKADKMPIGGHELKKERFFSKHTLNVSKSTTIYLFSDGYPDQFGGKFGKKFMVKQFKELLFSVHHLPMNQQQEILETTLSQWMEGHKQIDDITVIGIKVS
ncbi:MAG: hypothetical protein EAZ08_12705 [Cytophagales bacterium]|nr:MAG: hypothetical protein EAZ08_12705 [Cytophagales bacterium]